MFDFKKKSLFIQLLKNCIERMHSNLNNDKKLQEIGNKNGARAPFERHSPHAYAYLQQLERLPSIHSLVASNSDSKTLIREQNVRSEENPYRFPSPLSHPPTFTHPSLEPAHNVVINTYPTQNNHSPTLIIPPSTSINANSKPIKFYSFQYKSTNSSTKDVSTNNIVQDTLGKRTPSPEKSRPSPIKKQSASNSKVELSKEAIMKYMAYSQAEAADKLGVSLSTLRRLALFFSFFIVMPDTYFFWFHRRFTELNMNIRWPVHSKRSKNSKIDDAQTLQSSSDNAAQQTNSDESDYSISNGSLTSLDNFEKGPMHNVLNSDSADPKMIDGDLLAALAKAFSSHENNLDET